MPRMRSTLHLVILTGLLHLDALGQYSDIQSPSNIDYRFIMGCIQRQFEAMALINMTFCVEEMEQTHFAIKIIEIGKDL